MAFIKFNKAELVNLSYSLKREIISANKTGACLNTSIVTCNTRRYHGLLAVPVDNFGGNKHMLLSSVDESIYVGHKQFNLGIHCYGDVYEPRGHKYIVDFSADPVPQIVYKVGEIVFVKSLLMAPDKDQVMVKYELREAPSVVTLQLKPFLAFRNINALTAQNDQAKTDFKKISNGVAFQMYDGFPYLNLQMSSAKADFKYNPHWYNGITYSDEYRRGFDCKEDLWVPGFFTVELAPGTSVVLSASVEEENAQRLTRKFNDTVKKEGKITSCHDQLLHCADLLIRDRNGRKRITSGFSWLYTGQLRETLHALPGLTLYADGNKAQFEEILDNLIEDEQVRLHSKTTQIEAPLRIMDRLQMYIDFGADPKRVWKKYGGIVKEIIESYLPGHREEVAVQPNGLLWAQKDGIALNWMDAYVHGVPVTERAGFQVEANAYWYNSLCFAIGMEQKYGTKNSQFPTQWIPIRDLARQNYQLLFWNEQCGYLADYVDNEGQHMDVRPNMMAAVWVKNSPVDDMVASQVMHVISNELVTKRGIRTLSPRNLKYKGVYEGTQIDRDLAYHQGSTRPFLLAPYVDVMFRMRGAAFAGKAEWLTEGFFQDLNKHGVGVFAELYDGDPPHEPHGAISSALTTAALLNVDYLIKKYKED